MDTDDDFAVLSDSRTVRSHKNRDIMAGDMNMNGNPSDSSQSHQRMQCMEVWGGNQQADRHLEMPGLEAWIYSQPHEQAQGGGDVYYVSSCASGRITRILLADVSGHGSDASRLAVGLRELMRRNINIIQQNRFVAEMNKQFADLAVNHQFATAVVCSFFSPTKRLTLCNAGHPEPLCLQQHDGQWTSISQPSQTRELSDFPLGVLDDASYTQTILTLSGGDLVLLFSDAFVEAVDANGDLLGADGLLAIIRGLESVQSEGFISALIDAIRAEDPNNLSDDDATVLLIRATGTRPSIKNNLLAPFRMLRPARDHTELST